MIIKLEFMLLNVFLSYHVIKTLQALPAAIFAPIKPVSVMSFYKASISNEHIYLN